MASTPSPRVLLSLHAAPKEISGLSSAEAVFGQPLVLPGQLALGPEASPRVFHTGLSSSSPLATCQPCMYAEVAAQLPAGNLQSSEWVYMKRGDSAPPLAPPYLGPYKVVQPGLKHFLLVVGNQRESVSVDQLKPHLGSSPVLASSSPWRG